MSDATNFIIAVTGLLVALGGIATGIAKIGSLHKEINSRMTEMLELMRQKGMADARKEDSEK